MDADQEQAELKALGEFYDQYADEFEALERERDAILNEYAGALDKETVSELQAQIAT